MPDSEAPKPVVNDTLAAELQRLYNAVGNATIADGGTHEATYQLGAHVICNWPAIWSAVCVEQIAESANCPMPADVAGVVERLLFRADVGDAGRKPEPDDDLRVAAAMLTTLASGRDTWLPIETAPKNGKWFIAWDGFQVMPICWQDGDEDVSSKYEGWTYATNDWGGTLYDGFNEVKHQPTHWQPLPTQPQGDQQ